MSMPPICRRRGGRLDFRSPSLELAKIQVSPGFFPNREPSGSVLITFSMALPTSPEPPVTRITSPLVMIVEELQESVVRKGMPGVIGNDDLPDQTPDKHL